MEAITQAVRASDTDEDTGKGGGAFRLDDGSKAGLPVPESIPADTLAGLMAKHQDLWVMSVSGYDLVLKVAAVTHGDFATDLNASMSSGIWLGMPSLTTSTLDFQLRDRSYNVLQNLPNISFVMTIR